MFAGLYLRREAVADDHSDLGISNGEDRAKAQLEANLDELRRFTWRGAASGALYRPMTLR